MIAENAINYLKFSERRGPEFDFRRIRADLVSETPKNPSIIGLVENSSLLGFPEPEDALRICV